MKKFYTLIFALLATANLWAADFQIGELYYNITSDVAPYTVEVTYEEDSSSDNYSGLTTATIPASVIYSGTTYHVTSIGAYAFQYCSLASVTIPNSVTSIESYAFLGCDALTSITIPNSVTSIHTSAFAYCDALTSLVIEAGNTKYDSRNNCNAIIETATNTLVIGCKNTIIPNTVTSIGKEAFMYCTSLTSITIPNSVKSIGVWAFQYCTSLTSIVVEGGNTTYDSRENCNAIIETATNTLIAGCQNTVIPNTITSIGPGAFSTCHLTSIDIPVSVKSIGNSAFWGCYYLTSITIPSSVTSIGEFAFYGCSSLTSITIPNGVTSIGFVTFYKCSSLISITIPNSVTYIGPQAFKDCSSLTSVTLGSGVTSIGYEAFAGCTSLTSMTIPESVTSIRERAFYDCDNLKTVYVKAQEPPVLGE